MLDFISTQFLFDELDRLCSDPRFSVSSDALEALDAVKYWLIEAFVFPVE